MATRVLSAYINDAHVGDLSDDNGIWSFHYDQQWLNQPNAYPISPSIPMTGPAIVDQSSDRPVQWFFDNLLPEEGQRQLLAKDARVSSEDAFGLLEYYGSESAGSLTLLPQGERLDISGSKCPLPDDQLQERLEKLPQVSLAQGAIKRMSLAGAQHKLAVILDGDTLFEPAGNTPSTHILKPEHHDPSYPHSVMNEWFVMRLAKMSGLNTPDVHIRFVPSPVYLIDRFDRSKIAGLWSRRHAIDACQLLDLDKTYKYISGDVAKLVQIIQKTRNRVLAATELYKWLVFNVLTGNTDAHLKNISFIVQSDYVDIAPFYDLLSTAVYESKAYDGHKWPTETTLAWPILGVKFFSDITRELMLKAGIALGFNQAVATRILDRMIADVDKNSAWLVTEVEKMHEAMASARPELNIYAGGHIRLVRAIKYVIIQEMVVKLSSPRSGPA